MSETMEKQIQQLISYRGHHGGSIFWVNTSGNRGSDDANNPGLHWKTPLLTIARAHTLCTTGQNDYVIVIDAWSEDTEPIQITKDQVHIIGVGALNSFFGLPKMGEEWVKVSPGADTAVFEFTGDYCELAGFDIGGGATANGCVDLSQPIGMWIHHNRFGSAQVGGTPLNGIYLSQSCHGVLIEDNVFLGTGNGTLGTITGNGILCSETEAVSWDHGIAQRNLFAGIPDVAIQLRLAHGTFILDNVIGCDADTEGSAITLEVAGGGCRGCVINGNHANYGDTAMGASPFLDQCAAGDNSWITNYRAGLTIMPA